MLFSWKRRRTDLPPSAERNNPLPTSTLDWSAFEDAKSWVSIKIWLESDLAEKLDLLSAYRHQSRSEVMRDLLFIALYGHFLYAQLMSERRGLLRAPGQLQSGEIIFFDIADKSSEAKNFDDLNKLSKKIENIRLFVPKPMKQLLEKQAKKYQQTLSEAGRNLIEQSIYGVVGLNSA